MNVVQQTDDRGWSALHFAAVGGHREIAQMLLNTAHGASLSYRYARNASGNDPLALATEHGRHDVMSILLDSSFRFNPNACGNTCLHLAVLNADYEAACLLLRDARAAIGVPAMPNKAGLSAMDFAVHRSLARIVQLLGKHQAQGPSLGSEEQESSPLHLAAGKVCLSSRHAQVWCLASPFLSPPGSVERGEYPRGSWSRRVRS